MESALQFNNQLIPIEILNDLKSYGLTWDVGEGFISTYCNSKITSNRVTKILTSYEIPCHQMKTDTRIIVIYTPLNSIGKDL